MKDDTMIVPFHQPDSVADPLTEIARESARRMLAEALKAEADAFVAGFADETLPDGRRRMVRHGHGPKRSIQTGIGALDIQRPKMRDRAGDIPADRKVHFTMELTQVSESRMQPCSVVDVVDESGQIHRTVGRNPVVNNRARIIG